MDCSGLTSIQLPNSVTSIGDGAFWDCIGLVSVTIPNSVTKIERRTFYGCKNLTSVTIPNSVVTIGEYAFYKCSHLESIEIPNSVTSIEQYAFANCSYLTYIVCKAVIPPTLGHTVFYYVNKSIPLYVPDEAVNDYKAADQWKDFYIQPISALPQGVENIHSGRAQSAKALHNGQILILRGDRTYTPTGQEVR